MFLTFKGSFLFKLKGLQSNGRSLKVLDKVHNWIEKDFDKLYKSNNNEHLNKCNSISHNNLDNIGRSIGMSCKDKQDFNKNKFIKNLK